MTKNIFIIPLRVLIKQKVNSIIKIGGLAVGFSCSLLIILYLHFELSYDSFHKKAKNIYRVVEDITLSNGTTGLASASGPVGPSLVNDFPEVLRAVRFSRATMLMKYGDKHFQEDNIYFTDSTVFDMFTFPLSIGNSRTALSKPFSIVLTIQAAQRYFGDSNPIGQTLTIDNEFPFTVTGVIQNIPFNSHLRFDMLLSMATRESVSPGWLDNWNWYAYTYVEIDPESDPVTLMKKLPQFMANHTAEPTVKGEIKRDLSLQLLEKIHLHSKRTGEPGTPGNLSNLYLFSIIAVFIVLIACVNFVNLTTAQASRRAREVGVRKVIGGTRAQLAMQFLLESVFLTLGASLVALGICNLLLPVFGALIGLPVTMDVLFKPLSIVIYFSISFVFGCLAGCYPAIVFSGFRPIVVLKGSFKSSSRSSLFREGLIVIQFSISIVMIVATITVFSQLRYMQTKDLGYDKEGVVVIYFGDDADIQKRTETVKQELLRNPYLSVAAASSHIPGKEPGKMRAEMTTLDGEAKSVDVSLVSIDYDFIHFYNIPLVSGRGFSRQSTTDIREGLIVNEATVHQFGFEKADDILGKQLLHSGHAGTVIGVVKNFHYTSLHTKVGPMVIRMRPKSLSYISLKYNTNELPVLMTDLEKHWRALAPNRPFDYFFLDEQFDRLYRSDRQFGQVFAASATISILLACLGLFGLVAFTVEQRTKEIGIRKVLGASVLSVLVLLSKKFLKLVLIATLIATAISWYTMNWWLQEFPYRIHMQLWMFMSAGGVAILISQLTLSFQSVKAATANPTDSLRSE